MHTAGPWPVADTLEHVLDRRAYVRTQAWREASLAACPNHPAGGCVLRRHGTYRRKMRYGYGTGEMIITRAATEGRAEEKTRTDISMRLGAGGVLAPPLSKARTPDAAASRSEARRPLQPYTEHASTEAACFETVCLEKKPTGPYRINPCPLKSVTGIVRYKRPCSR